MITLNKGRYVNFLGVADTTIPYRDQGLVLITGENGNGKSSLFIEGPYYGLYGGSIRYGDRPGDLVIKEGQKAFAVIHELDIDGETYVIARTKKFKKLKLTGDLSDIDYPDGLSVWHNGQNEARGHAAHTQEWLESLYAMGPRTFLSSAMFTADTLRFPLLPDTKKKEILDELLQLGVLEVALEKTKVKKKALETEIVQLNSKRELLESQVPSIEAEIEALLTRNLSWADERDIRAEKARQAVLAAQEALQKAKDDQTTIRAALQTEQAECAQRQKKLEGARQALQSAREEFLQSKVTIDSRVSAQRQTVTALQKELDAKEVLMGTQCVKCGQEVPRNDEWVQEKRAQIEKEKKKLEAALEEQSGTQGKASELGEAKAMLDEREKKLSERTKKLTKITALADKAGDAVTNASSAAATAETRLHNIEAEVNPYHAQLDAARHRLEQTKGKLEALGQGDTDKKQALANEKILEACFGTKGCRSYLLERVTPALNLAASTVRSILDTQLMVSFSVRGDDEAYAGSFEVNVQNPGKAATYKGDSSGERRRVDMIMMFSLLSLAAQRGAKSFSQAIFDEAFENLDEKGQQGVLNLLKHESQRRSSLFALTHAGYELKGNVAKVWTVYPEGRIDFGNS